MRISNFILLSIIEIRFLDSEMFDTCIIQYLTGEYSDS